MPWVEVAVPLMMSALIPLPVGKGAVRWVDVENWELAVERPVMVMGEPPMTVKPEQFAKPAQVAEVVATLCTARVLLP